MSLEFLDQLYPILHSWSVWMLHVLLPEQKIDLDSSSKLALGPGMTSPLNLEVWAVQVQLKCRDYTIHFEAVFCMNCFDVLNLVYNAKHRRNISNLKCDLLTRWFRDTRSANWNMWQWSTAFNAALSTALKAVDFWLLRALPPVLHIFSNISPSIKNIKVQKNKSHSQSSRSSSTSSISIRPMRSKAYFTPNEHYWTIIVKVFVQHG